MAWDSPKPGCIAECFEGAKDLSDVGQRLAQLHGRPGRVENEGPVVVYPDTKAIDSGFASYSTHLNGMPVNKRLVGVDGPEAGDNGEDGVGIFINHIPAGGLPLVNMHGDGGFGLRMKSGVLWNQGESWVLKAAKVQAVGELTDEKTYSLPSGASSTYYFANCYNCGDSKGRSLTREPVRVFSKKALADTMVGTTVYYLRDQSGVAWMIDAVSESNSVKYAKATGVWDWVDEYTDKVGYALFQDANDLFGDTAGASETTYTVYLRATAGADPNIHENDVVTYEVDASGNRIADSGYLDSKINSGERWYGTTSDIKAGWIEATQDRGRFAVGYDPDDADYNTLESTGGSHPITPAEHSSNSETTTFDIDDHEFTSSENTTHITVTAHPQTTSSTNATGLTVANHLAKDTSSSATGVNNHSAGTSGSGNLNLNSHTDHLNLVETTSRNILESTAPGFTSITFVTSVSAGGSTLSHASQTHTHSTPELSHAGDEHTHSVSLYEHTITDGGHAHTSSPLDHVVVDGGHSHTSTLPHTGTLPHVSEDYRPPYSTVLWIRRVHPDQE